MDRTWVSWCGLATMVMAVLSCAAGVSEQARSQVTYMGTFAQVQAQPQTYTGETVMWGGKIVQTQPGNNQSELMVLQLELGSQNRPQDDDSSQGRFLARSKQFLDPALYPPGTLITVVGRLTGSEERLIGKMAYQYPVVDIIEAKKWPNDTDNSPRFHFGIGIGKTF